MPFLSALLPKVTTRPGFIEESFVFGIIFPSTSKLNSHASHAIKQEYLFMVCCSLSLDIDIQ
jgi:hypothetical protein